MGAYSGPSVLKNMFFYCELHTLPMTAPCILTKINTSSSTCQLLLDQFNDPVPGCTAPENKSLSF